MSPLKSPVATAAPGGPRPRRPRPAPPPPATPPAPRSRRSVASPTSPSILPAQPRRNLPNQASGRDPGPVGGELLDLGAEAAAVGRLAHEPGRAQAQRLLAVLPVLGGGQHHHRQVPGAVVGAEVAEHLEAAHPRHLQVEQDELGQAAGLEAGPGQPLKGLLAVGRDLDGDGHAGQVGQGPPDQEHVVLVVLDQQDSQRSHRYAPAVSSWAGQRAATAAGRKIRTSVPRSPSMPMAPPSTSTILRQMASPIPVPSLVEGPSRRSKTPNTRSRCSAGMPWPLSRTDSSTPPSGRSWPSTTTTRSGRPPWRTAFSSRLVNSCRSPTGSPVTTGRRPTRNSIPGLAAPASSAMARTR